MKYLSFILIAALGACSTLKNMEKDDERFLKGAAATCLSVIEVMYAANENPEKLNYAQKLVIMESAKSIEPICGADIMPEPNDVNQLILNKAYTKLLEAGLKQPEN